MNSTIKRILLSVLLISVVATGFADAANPADISNLPGNGTVVMGTVPGADMSIKYLGQLFGSVGGVLNSSTHVQLLQEVFGIFNKAILALALAWTGYTILTILFSSAMEGGFVTSQRKQAVFIFARLAIGFSLLLPLSSGYSALQVMGMRAMIEGVNLANKVWDETLYFISTKGIIHNFSDKQSANDTPAVNKNGWNGSASINGATTTSSNKPTGSQMLMYNMLCTAYFASNNPTSTAAQGPIYVPPKSATDHTQYIDFPGNNSKTGCGQFRLTDIGSAQDIAQGQIQNSMVFAMWPVAQDVIAQYANDSGKPTDVNLDDNSSTLASILTNYVASTQLNIRNNKPKTKDDYTSDTAWEVQAADQGWFGAGRFYWLLSQANWNNVQGQSTGSSASDDIPWPVIGTSGSSLSASSVVMASNTQWNAAKATKVSNIQSGFNSSVIPMTQNFINANQSPFSSDPAGMITYNGNGLCVDETTIKDDGALAAAGMSDVRGHDIAWGYDYIPAGIDSSGNQLYSANYLQLPNLSSGIISAIGSNHLELGVCGMPSPTGNTFNRPVLVGWVRGSTTQSVNNANALRGGKNYPGARLCARTGVTTVNNTQFADEVGFCNSAVAAYSGAAKLPGGVTTDVTFSSAAIDGPNYAMPVVPQVLSTVGNKFASLETEKSEGLTDPVYFMTQLGMTMMGQAGYLWDQGSTYIKNMALATGVFSAIGAGATIFQGYMSWWEPVFLMLGGGLFVAGFMLCFYAPLYPFVLFTLGAINWLMVCVEFMIALPLVALGITHPEGHDFLGKAEIALMLTLSACLRPVLMIIGYVGAMVMSFIGFSAVNYMFSSVMVAVFGNMPMSVLPRIKPQVDQLYQNTPTVFQSIFGVVTNDWSGQTGQSKTKFMFTGSETSDMLLIPLLMVFYGYIVVEVVNFCFSMIHQIPDQVLRWIGGPVGQDRTQGVANKIQSGVQGAAKQAGDTAGKGAMNQGKAVGGAIGGSVGAGITVASDVAKMVGA